MSHLVCVTPASPEDKKKIRNDWRSFVLPGEDAERLFRVNVDVYYNTPKLNGKPKVKKGALQDFVGSPPIPITYVRDHQGNYAPFENARDRLE